MPGAQLRRQRGRLRANHTRQRLYRRARDRGARIAGMMDSRWPSRPCGEQRDRIRRPRPPCRKRFALGMEKTHFRQRLVRPLAEQERYAHNGADRNAARRIQRLARLRVERYHSGLKHAEWSGDDTAARGHRLDIDAQRVNRVSLDLAPPPANLLRRDVQSNVTPELLPQRFRQAVVPRFEALNRLCLNGVFGLLLYREPPNADASSIGGVEAFHIPGESRPLLLTHIEPLQIRLEGAVAVIRRRHAIENLQRVADVVFARFDASVTEASLLSGHLPKRHAGAANRLQQFRGPAVDELRAILYGRAGQAVVLRTDAAADPVARLEDDHASAGFAKFRGRCKPGYAGAYDDHIAVMFRHPPYDAANEL